MPAFPFPSPRGPVRPVRSGLFPGTALLALCLAGMAAAAPTPDLQQIMADPDWIGAPVEAAWWQLDGSSVTYRTRRRGTERTDLYAVDPTTGRSRRLTYAEQAGRDGPSPVLDEARRQALFLRENTLFLRSLDDGALVQITSAGAPATAFAFSRGGGAVHFRRAGQWWRHDLASGVARALTDLRMEAAPWAVPEENALEQEQLRYFVELRDAVEEAREAHAEALEAAAADPARDVPPWYLGSERKIVESRLSTDGRWLLAVTAPAGAEEGRQDHMPKYVTRSGYVEIEDVRRLVGRDGFTPHGLWLLDLEHRERYELTFDGLSGIDVDPLAALKAAQDMAPHDAENPRPVRVTAIDWHPQRAVAAVRIRSLDNKDRWLATVEADAPALTERHRLTDPAWVNWEYNESGWLEDSETLWLLSEESGFSHLYTVDTRSGLLRQITEGGFEVFDVLIEPGGTTALALSNASHPTEYDLYRIDLASGAMARQTELLGVESYARHPRSGDLLIRHSRPYVPPQLSLRRARDAGPVRQLTDTRTDEYREVEWQAPAIVAVPSRHGVGRPIWSKFYAARDGADGGGPAADGGRPAVLFVHGAGYTQNTHHRFPYYFREQMFHNLLTERGYHVLDMDYRASRGYGRAWRTAIYRQMGTPELEDLVDGVAWLVEEHGVDPRRVGIYGGSYGGFMTFMALFRAADTFAAGASLRPVTDWTHYNHPYTSAILNTPQVDPEAYRRSSPIEFVEGLRGSLLISHGMLDDNVFFKDSVRLAQRLIDLGKEDWELAMYPLEAHAYVHAQSWRDQYRRILALFTRTIGRLPEAAGPATSPSPLPQSPQRLQ